MCQSRARTSIGLLAAPSILKTIILACSHTIHCYLFSCTCVKCAVAHKPVCKTEYAQYLALTHPPCISNKPQGHITPLHPLSQAHTTL